MMNHYRLIVKILSVFFISLKLLLSPASLAALSDDLINQGLGAFQQGHFVQAIHYWEQALTPLDRDQALRIDTLRHLSAAYQALGFFPKAFALLKQALRLADKDSKRAVLVNTALCDLYLATLKTEQTQDCIDKTVEKARQLGDSLILANVLHTYGNVLSVQGDSEQALTTYQESARLAAQAGDLLLSSKALTNSVQVHLDQFEYNKGGDIQQTFAALKKAFKSSQQLSESCSEKSGGQTAGVCQTSVVFGDKAFILLAISQLARRFQKHATDIAPQLNGMIWHTLNTALQFAKMTQNSTIASYANGYLGELYESHQRYDEALQLTRRALFYAQQLQAEELLYRWQWQLGRLFKAQGKMDEAITAYQRAVNTLTIHFRQDLTSSQHRLYEYDNEKNFFKTSIAPVYFELADLLLQQATFAKSQLKRQTLLKNTREIVENLKQAQLQNYFQDDCVKEWLAKKQPLDQVIQINQQTAVLYPVILPNRVELLLSLPNKTIAQERVTVAQEKIDNVVDEWRADLKDLNTQYFLPSAKQLYDWLIRPLEVHLISNGIDTLVIVPYGKLGTIPLAALHDGKQFLIQKYALATTPGLTLTDPTPLRERENVQVMLGGLSKGIKRFGQYFKPLSNVPKELDAIQTIYSQSLSLADDKFLDGQFLIKDVETKFKRKHYTIVHIASHGKFNSDPQKSFILTYDDKLTMDRLESLIKYSRFRYDNPLELLTLSACETAASSRENAALGLAGVAIKAGARSALATLWQVADESTSQLVEEFYKQLKYNQLSKAKALQKAQLRLLQTQYPHPYHWAAFLLIGNWL